MNPIKELHRLKQIDADNKELNQRNDELTSMLFEVLKGIDIMHEDGRIFPRTVDGEYTETLTGFHIKEAISMIEGFKSFYNRSIKSINHRKSAMTSAESHLNSEKREVAGRVPALESQIATKQTKIDELTRYIVEMQDKFNHVNESMK